MTGQWREPARVLVVGTTDDYIDWIRKACPEQALFLTQPAIRESSGFDAPGPHEEVLTDLDQTDQALASVREHLTRFSLTLSGIACFDCERMTLAADLAQALGLSYPNRAAIENARDKYQSKAIWLAQGVRCPRMAGINRPEDVLDFMDSIRGPVVLKPVAGSGSELVFKCQTPRECTQAFGAIRDGLAGRKDHPLFKTQRQDLMLAEEMIEGPEFSADFVVEKESVRIIRVARKIKYRSHPFGTIAGYQLLSDPEAALDLPHLTDHLFRGAKSLGIDSGICMADFIRNKKRENVLVEMTPRPGGDCLPFLIKEAAGIDMLALALDVARGIPWGGQACQPCQPLIGVRLFAHRSGTLKKVDTSALAGDHRVKTIRITKNPGHKIVMPPEDYDSWILGHVILAPDGRGYPETQSRLMTYRVRVEVV